MARLHEMFDKYDYFIFDMDGVITSEQNYWDIAALSVYELLNSKTYFGNKILNSKELLDDVSNIRSHVFCSDLLIKLLKEKGVNSNWDLAYVVFAYMLSGKFSSYEDVHTYLASSPLVAFDMYAECTSILSKRLNLPLCDCDRNEKIWCMCRDCFQEWYLGSNGFFEMYHKKANALDKISMEEREIPVISLDDITNTLLSLKRAGKHLRIATGRSTREVSQPLDLWDIRKYFDFDGIATYSHIEQCEAEMAQKNRPIQLTKPHPFIFLKGLYGTDYSNDKILSGDYDKSLLEKSLVIGDAGSDILAAKEMPCDFLAVLTGVSGEKSRTYFEKLDSEYILPSIAAMAEPQQF